ncbi:MAG: hypothetical protein ACRC5V_02940 [Aeromonas sp.]
MGKAYKILQGQDGGIEGVEAAWLFQELYPDMSDFAYTSPSIRMPTFTDMLVPSEDEIKEEAARLDNGKTGGATGMLPVHLKFMVQRCGLAKLLLGLFSDLIADPKSAIAECPILYRFRAVFIPKNEVKYRPIAV